MHPAKQFSKMLDERAERVFNELGTARTAFSEGLDGAARDLDCRAWPCINIIR